MGTLTDELSRVGVQAEEIGRALHNHDLFISKHGKSITDESLDGRRVVSFVNRVLLYI